MKRISILTSFFSLLFICASLQVFAQDEKPVKPTKEAVRTEVSKLFADYQKLEANMATDASKKKELTEAYNEMIERMDELVHPVPAKTVKKQQGLSAATVGADKDDLIK